MNAVGMELLGGIQNFLSVIDILFLLRFCYSSGEKRKWKHYVIAGLVFCVYAIIMGILLNSGTGALFVVYVYLVIAGICFTKKRKWAVPFMLIPAMLLYYFWSNFCILLCSMITWNKFDSSIGEGLIFSICEDFALAVILFLVIKKKERQYPAISLNLGESILVSVFCFFSMFFIAVFEILDETLMNGTYTFAWMLFVIILNVIVPYGIIHRCRARYYRSLSDNYKEQFEMEYYFFQDYKEQQRDEAKVRHDWKNHMLLLQSMFEKGEYEKAKDYFVQLTDKKKLSGNYFLTGNEIVDMILNAKQEKIQKYNIKVTCGGGLEALKFMEAIDCCILFSNLIDNAIEANSKCEGNRYLDICATQSAGMLMISLENRTCQELQQEDNRLLTTKKDKKNHGWGTANAFEVIRKYHGEYHITSEDGVFVIKILFPCSGDIG